MLNAAIIGMGRWGQVLVNSVQGKNDAGIRFVAGSTGTPDKARAFCAEKGIRLHENYEAVIAAARAGKHVFIEKPFTLTKASAEAAVAACRAAGVVMALGHNRRFLPAVAEMKRMIADGELGTLLHAEGNMSGSQAFTWKAGMWRADREESPLGGMGGMGIHMIDMLINLMGPFAQVSVQSFARVSDHVDDTTAMLARFASGASCNFATVALTTRCWRVALFGTKGMMELFNHERLFFRPVEGKEWTRDYPVVDIEAAELAAFAAAVAGGPAYPLPLEDAIHGVSVFETMIAAAKSGSMLAVP
jgi:predicted dehydrogenase